MKTRVIELSVNNRKEVIELPINPPSCLLYTSHFGKKIEAVAGFPECMKSHNNIPVKLDKETV